MKFLFFPLFILSLLSSCSNNVSTGDSDYDRYLNEFEVIVGDPDHPDCGYLGVKDSIAYLPLLKEGPDTLTVYIANDIDVLTEESRERFRSNTPFCLKLYYEFNIGDTLLRKGDLIELDKESFNRFTLYNKNLLTKNHEHAFANPSYRFYYDLKLEGRKDGIYLICPTPLYHVKATFYGSYYKRVDFTFEDKQGGYYLYKCDYLPNYKNLDSIILSYSCYENGNEYGCPISRDNLKKYFETLYVHAVNN